MSFVAWITGAHGFIGRHLSRECARRGMHVAGVGHGRWSATEAEAWGLSHWVPDTVSIRSLEELARLAPPPHSIFHVAGGSSVGLSVAAPVEDFDRSVRSTTALLAWAGRSAPSAVIVLASSAAVYGSGCSTAIPEAWSSAPCSPYGHHKRVAELLCEEFAARRGLRVCIARMFSVYGPHLRKQLLWDLCLRLSRDPRELRLSGTGGEARDFLHVDDAARFLLHCATRARWTDPCIVRNGGTGVGTTVQEAAEMLVSAWSRRTPVRFTGRSRPGDPDRLVADAGIARSEGWLPAVPIEEGIRSYVSWFRGVPIPIEVRS